MRFEIKPVVVIFSSRTPGAPGIVDRQVSKGSTKKSPRKKTVCKYTCKSDQSAAARRLTAHVPIKSRNLLAVGLHETDKANKKQEKKHTTRPPHRRGGQHRHLTGPLRLQPALTFFQQEEELTSTSLHFCSCPWVHLTPKAKPRKTCSVRTAGRRFSDWSVRAARQVIAVLWQVMRMRLFSPQNQGFLGFAVYSTRLGYRYRFVKDLALNDFPDLVFICCARLYSQQIYKNSKHQICFQDS